MQTNQKIRELPKSLLYGCVPKVRFGDNLVNFACKSKYLNGGVGTRIDLKFTKNVYIILCQYLCLRNYYCLLCNWVIVFFSILRLSSLNKTRAGKRACRRVTLSYGHPSGN